MDLQQIDKKHLWHPLTQHELYPNHIAIKKAKGALLYDTNGNQYMAWDVSNVTNMNSMFEVALEFDIDLSGWNVSKVEDMDKMF